MNLTPGQARQVEQIADGKIAQAIALLYLFRMTAAPSPSLSGGGLVLSAGAGLTVEGSTAGDETKTIATFGLPDLRIVALRFTALLDAAGAGLGGSIEATATIHKPATRVIGQARRLAILDPGLVGCDVGIVLQGPAAGISVRGTASAGNVAWRVVIEII